MQFYFSSYSLITFSKKVICFIHCVLKKTCDRHIVKGALSQNLDKPKDLIVTIEPLISCSLLM